MLRAYGTRGFERTADRAIVVNELIKKELDTTSSSELAIGERE